MTAPLPNAGSNDGDEIDRLLRRYFQAKMPREFPALPIAASPISPLSKSGPLSRGRWIMAACVVAVVLGFGYLMSVMPKGNLPGAAGFDNSSATNSNPMPPKR